MKAVRSFLKRLSFDLFMLGDRLGVHFLPKHYHTPIPDYRWLRHNRMLWARRASLTGVHWDLDEQLRWLTRLCSPDRKSTRLNSSHGYISYAVFCFIKKKKVAEIPYVHGVKQGS